MSKQQIKSLCKKYRIKDYTINDDMSVDVDGHVNLDNMNITELPLTFRNIHGCFMCNGNNLTTLKGSPVYVGFDFLCGGNSLTSLEFSPRTVGGSFSCSENLLTSLEHSPGFVHSNFHCNDNPLQTFNGLALVINGSFCYFNHIYASGDVKYCCKRMPMLYSYVKGDINTNMLWKI